jgi:ATP-dependent RNA helicase DDX56/DBP9
MQKMDEDGEDTVVNFHEMGLDDRIQKAIARLGWLKPLPIQEKTIPLALEGKDILARARTGSGKTAAYAIPIIQKILATKQVAREQCIKAIVMTPTRELCHQAAKNIAELCTSCSRDVRCVDVSSQQSLEAQKPLLAENPDIVVGTPSRILGHVRAGNVDLKSSIEVVVIDEADLLFSFGYEQDMRALLTYLPKIYQAFLMSATLSEQVLSLKKLILHNPVVLKLNEAPLPDASQLTQYHVKCEEDDKFLLLYALVKLRLIRGKMIIFVNTVDRCFKLKLYLEQFGIPSCILNSELPVRCRCQIVSQFNEGLYDIIIAADEVALEDPTQVKTGAGKQQTRSKKRDKESGISRGIDFQNVSNIVNFDFPLDVNSYIHKVGRTARGGNSGTALSFVTVREMPRLAEVQKKLGETHPEGEAFFKPYQFKMDEVEGLRYRAMDAMRSVTRIAIKEARSKEISEQMAKSERLKVFWSDNPRDLQLLRHDMSLHTIKTKPHMKNMPDYLVPKSLRRMGAFTNTESKRPRKKQEIDRRHPPTLSRGQQRFQKRKADPLKSFELGSLKKKRRTK